jgi:hypothetical protein
MPELNTCYLAMYVKCNLTDEMWSRRTAFSPKNSFNLSDKIVTLFSTLIFIGGYFIGLQFLLIDYQGFILIKEHIIININHIIY